MPGSENIPQPPERDAFAKNEPQVGDWGNEIMRQIGTDRSTDLRRLYDAIWDDPDTGRKFLLEKRINDTRETYFLRVFEPFTSIPNQYFKHYSPNGVTIECDENWNRVANNDSQIAEQQMSTYLRSSQVSIDTDYSKASVERKFWELACVYALTDEALKPTLNRIRLAGPGNELGKDIRRIKGNMRRQRLGIDRETIQSMVRIVHNLHLLGE